MHREMTDKEILEAAVETMIQQFEDRHGIMFDDESESDDES